MKLNFTPGFQKRGRAKTRKRGNYHGHAAVFKQQISRNKDCRKHWEDTFRISLSYFLLRKLEGKPWLCNFFEK